MKNLSIKMFTALLLVWYSMSIIGFDVHTCNGSGRSFVVTFMEGFTCADIHPEHKCDKASCCTGHHEGCCGRQVADHPDCSYGDGVSIKAKSCCSNDYQVLDLTGTPAANDHENSGECGCGHCPCSGLPAFDVPALFHENILAAYIHEPDSGFGKACERQAALRIWRI